MELLIGQETATELWSLREEKEAKGSLSLPQLPATPWQGDYTPWPREDASKQRLVPSLSGETHVWRSRSNWNLQSRVQERWELHGEKNSTNLHNSPL